MHATDALANERTFLAYVRTALAFVGFGFVIARFSVFLREAAIVAHVTIQPSGLSNAFGAAMALAGVAFAVFGGYRYVVASRALRAGSVAPLGDVAALFGTVVVAAIGVVVAIELVAVR